MFNLIAEPVPGTFLHRSVEVKKSPGHGIINQLVIIFDPLYFLQMCCSAQQWWFANNLR